MCGVIVLVFCGDDGLDELMMMGYSWIWEVMCGDIYEYDFDLWDFGILIVDFFDFIGGLLQYNVEVFCCMFEGEMGVVCDIVFLNVVVGIVVFELLQDVGQVQWLIFECFCEGYEKVLVVVDDGCVLVKFDQWISVSCELVVLKV